MLCLIFEREMIKKTAPGTLRFVIILFLIFGKWMSKKTAQRILRFVTMRF